MANIQLSSETSRAYIDYAASVINSEVQTMTSLQIAEVTNKRHDAVLRDIRNLLEQGVQAHNFVELFNIRELPNGGSKQEPYFQLTKKGCLILASGYNALLREKIIDRWELLETERAVATPNNPQLQFVQAQLYVADALSQRLRLNEASRLGMYQSIAEPYRLAIPQYVESKGVTKALKDLLEDMHSPYSAIKFNQMLEAQGYIETKTRPSSGGSVKRFKSITDKGLAYGENLQSPRNQKETQPHWYADKFNELYNVVTA